MVAVHVGKRGVVFGVVVVQWSGSQGERERDFDVVTVGPSAVDDKVASRRDWAQSHLLQAPSMQSGDLSHAVMHANGEDAAIWPSWPSVQRAAEKGRTPGREYPERI